MKKKRTILLLEDDANLAFILTEHLEQNGFAVLHRTNGTEGLAALRNSSVVLCLVDVMMPAMDGFTFVKELRKADSALPVIFLTAKSLKEDRIEGLRIGADDYITKPFSMEELLLRIAAVLKRTAPAPIEEGPAEFLIGSLRFDVRRSVLIAGTKKKQIPLTAKEAGVLAVLCRSLNTVVPRERILREVWQDDSVYTARSMDVYLTKLRKHLKADSSVSLLTVHGSGYKLLVGA